MRVGVHLGSGTPTLTQLPDPGVFYVFYYCYYYHYYYYYYCYSYSYYYKYV